MRAHVLVAGAGPPLVMMAGAFFPAASLEPLISALQSRFTIYAVDRPGCGASDPVSYSRAKILPHTRDFMRDVLEALDLSQTSIMASSLGGFFAIVHAAALPKTMDRLLCLGPPYGIDHHVPASLRLLSTPVLGRLLFAAVARPTPSRMQALLRSMVSDPAHVSLDLAELLAAAMRRPGAARSWTSTIRGLAGWRGLNPETVLFDVLPTLSVPTCTVWGSRDNVTPPSRGAAVMRAIPKGSVKIVEGAAHLVWLDAPEACIDIAGRFLENQAEE